MPDHGQYYSRLSAAIESGSPVWQATVVETDGSTPARIGMKLAIPVSGETFGNLGGGEMEHLVISTIRREKPQAPVRWQFNLDEKGKAFSDSEVETGMLCGGRAEVLVEPLFATHPLYIIGAGHCGRALAEFAVKTDFQVTVIDNRKDLLQQDAFPSSCRLVYNDYTALDEAISFDENAFIVIMTYGHVHDRQVLEYCLGRTFRYLGMIGSKNKVAETLEKLKGKGVAEHELKRIHAPVGLSIGSHTPHEIAVSILAELIQTRNQA
jgi:xanthine dehydrogenase accessory factor